MRIHNGGMTLYLLLMMLGISFFDFRSYTIPDLFQVFLLIGRLFISTSMKEICFSAANGLCVALPLFLLRFLMNHLLHQECMGDGDLKLVFSLGIYFDLFHDLLALLFACIFGLLLSLFYLRKQKRMIPFGPCICGGFLIILLWNGP